MRNIKGVLTNELKNHTSNRTVGKDAGYKVHTFRGLVENVAKLAYTNKDYLLFFRGQSSDYKNSNGNSTFYPTIYRSDYLTQSELEYRFDRLNSASRLLIDLFKKNKIEGYTEIQRKKLIQWSIIQHYEVTETPLIDVTQSLRVACSFANLDNKNENAFIYVFGLPYYTNRISINSEDDLINIRLLSISPPQALRPYFQEGYLVGTDEITSNYNNKSELDLNNRLIAKFEIPNDPKFWGDYFHQIPRDALYPEKDLIKEICDEVKQNIIEDISSVNLGNYIKVWTDLEQKLINKAKRYISNTHFLRNSLYVLNKYEPQNSKLYEQVTIFRNFRNRVVHKPGTVSNKEIAYMYEELIKFTKLL